MRKPLTLKEELARLERKRQEERIKAQAFSIDRQNNPSFKTFLQDNRSFIQPIRQEADFTPEQEVLRQLFGSGEKIWGTEMNPVQINHALSPSFVDDYNETSDLFGFGRGRGKGTLGSERSGLW